jgi:ArsR family transcriptional regulator
VRSGPPEELPAYLLALRTLLPARALAVDVGTGDGALLEALAPLFDRVIALDRSDAQLELAAGRARRRGFDNVDLVRGAIDGPEVRAAVRRRSREGADVVFASRVLHHAPTPARALRALTELAKPGGAVLVLDYEAHDDEQLRAQEADFWLGFEPSELERLAREAGLEGAEVTPIPDAFRGEGPDRHVGWQLLAGRRAGAHAARDERSAEKGRVREPTRISKRERNR